MLISTLQLPPELLDRIFAELCPYSYGGFELEMYDPPALKM
jgi:hypothetical protein